METLRGFVLKIEVGRAGLVRVTVLLDSGNVRIFVITDLDADPERFNERLSKLAIVRDAMDRGEPIEIETIESEAGEEIERVARIARDDLQAIPRVVEIIGFVLNIVIHAEDRTGSYMERGDRSLITVLGSDFKGHELMLPMQIPERQVAVEQLQLIRDAQAQGYPVRFLVVEPQSDVSNDVFINNGDSRGRIIAVEMLEDANIFGGGDNAELVYGFVESVSLIRVTGSDQHNFAHIRFTTSPPINGVGATVPLVPFTPEMINLLVPQNSPSYELFVDGLRDNLLMRTQIIEPRLSQREPVDSTPATPAAGQPAPNNIRAAAPAGTSDAPTAAAVAERQEVYNRTEKQKFYLAFAAELNAHLASAARPVWLMISRDSLDIGPEGDARCVIGTPTSDLRVSTLRDLRIPYDAVWFGLACANPGIYRFQIDVPTQVELFVDGREVCIHDAVVGTARFGHACLGGEHEIKIIIRDWVCDYDFVMDVYQLR